MPSTNFQYNGQRNSYTELNKIYFWTITINNWQHLLKPDENKMIVINSLQWLVNKALIKVYGYVIMPNHIHLLWEQLSMNSKEFPKNSFEKFTAKSLVDKIKIAGDTSLKNYIVSASDRHHNIWQRDPLAIYVFNLEMALQKLKYMYLNPMQQHWQLFKSTL
jgi:putative transposase